MRQREARGHSIKVCGPHISSYSRFMRNHTTVPVLEESYIVRVGSLESNTCWDSSTQINLSLTSIHHPSDSVTQLDHCLKAGEPQKLTSGPYVARGLELYHKIILKR